MELNKRFWDITELNDNGSKNKIFKTEYILELMIFIESIEDKKNYMLGYKLFDYGNHKYIKTYFEVILSDVDFFEQNGVK